MAAGVVGVAPGVANATLAGAMRRPARATSARGASRVPILGFQEEGDPTEAIARSAAGLNSVGVDGVALTGRGELSPINGDELRQLETARAYHLPGVLLVTNYSDRINDFSERLAHRTLDSREAIRRVVKQLRADVDAYGWNGVMLDIESLRPRDSAGLVALVHELRVALPPSVAVSLTLSNNTSTGGFAHEGYDIEALARTHAQLVLMAYDLHGPWENTPGPIGPLGWAARGVRVLRAVAPASQIWLGVAAYGYGWRRRHHYVYSDSRAAQLAKARGAKARWDASAGEWTAKLPGGATIWWSDARSLRVHMALARRLHLAGVAVWSLGESDPIDP